MKFVKVLLIMLFIVCVVFLIVFLYKDPRLKFYLIDEGTAYEVSKRDKYIRGSIIIPEEYKGKPVTSIRGYGFYNSSKLKSITIPSSVTNVGSEAFSYCDDLVITWYYNPELTAKQFKNQLTRVIIPKNVTRIGDEAFYGCRDVKNITIPKSVTTIGKRAFRASGLKDISIPNNVTYIGSEAFYDCWWLTNITLPEGIKSIQPYTFYTCNRLTSITIPESIEKIGDFAFYSCHRLESITIPNGVTNIGDSAFSGCSGLKSVIIPPSVTNIGDKAFFSCRGLRSITLNDGLTSIGTSAFYGCFKLKNVAIPSTVTKIGSHAFRYCQELTSITIPNSVVSIGSDAFLESNNLTIYTEFINRSNRRDSLWNKDKRPVIWECTFSEDKTYVISIDSNKISNSNAANGVFVPYREGYTFEGWAVNSDGTGIVYSEADLIDAPYGTLYAVWINNK